MIVWVRVVLKRTVVGDYNNCCWSPTTILFRTTLSLTQTITQCELLLSLSSLSLLLLLLLFVKNLNFVAGMTRRFVSAKRLIRYFSNSSKLVEHRAQSPVREVKMLAVWPSIAEGFPTASSRVYMQYAIYFIAYKLVNLRLGILLR